MSEILLEDAFGRVEISRLGAEVLSWSVGGRALVWTPDPAIWPQTAPILFPVVGWTKGAKVRIEGRDYPLGLHGFAQAQVFEVVEHWPTHVHLRLRATPATLALYPFRFVLDVRYALDDGGLATTLTVTNADRSPMPYACGLHPGFRWPFAGGAAEDYTILFAEREGSSVPLISPEGLFTHQTRRIPIDGRRLDLSPSLLAREALCFLEARSRSLRFVHRSGAAIEVVLDDFPHLALWSRAPGAFVCIEAWTGHGDYVDHDGDLANKPSMRWLAPGARASHGAKFSFVPPHHLLQS